MNQPPSSPLKMTILGSGTCVPSLRRSACAIMVESGSLKLVLDVGPGTMRRLLECATTVHEITHILLSHFHPDHTGELATFLFANNYPDSERRRVPLNLVGAHGILDFYQRLKGVYGDWIELAGGLLTITEVSQNTHDRLAVNGIDIQTMPVVHRPESIAYRISTREGKALVYSGDTDYSDNLISLARDADLLICEASLPDEMKVEGHLTPSIAGEIATRAHVGRLMLTHFYPECDQTDIIAQCRRTYNGDLVIAEDRMTVTL